MSCKWIAAAAPLLLAGCQTAGSHIGDEDPALGEAVKYNAALQTINPAPVYPENGAQPGDNGDKGAKAVERYRTDQVNDRHSAQARSLNTTKSTSSGGGPQ